jgi:hypothetical protein
VFPRDSLDVALFKLGETLIEGYDETLVGKAVLARDAPGRRAPAGTRAAPTRCCCGAWTAPGARARVTAAADALLDSAFAGLP